MRGGARLEDPHERTASWSDLVEAPDRAGLRLESGELSSSHARAASRVSDITRAPARSVLRLATLPASLAQPRANRLRAVSAESIVALTSSAAAASAGHGSIRR